MASRWCRHTFADGKCIDCGLALYHDVRKACWPKNGAICYSNTAYDGQSYYQERQPLDWLPCSERRTGPSAQSG